MGFPIRTKDINFDGLARKWPIRSYLVLQDSQQQKATLAKRVQGGGPSPTELENKRNDAPGWAERRKGTHIRIHNHL